MPIESKDLADLRRDYLRQELSESSAAADPFVQFANWFEEYLNSGPLEPNAMTLSTANRDARPSSRVVLLKGFTADGFVFFTNYQSTKARHLAENPFAALHFFWPELERQIAIEGKAAKVERDESESYFLSRPLESRIGAWASKQSSVLTGRKELEERITEVRARFGDDVPCPPFWGGFRVVPDRFEFWQGRPSRLHDRILYIRSGDTWDISRLSP
jgi:pyridoxamine 5'-phosphate oxidase